MKLTKQSGTAIVIHGDELKVMTYSPGHHYSSTYVFNEGKHDETNIEDYDPRFDTYYLPGDDGTIYESIHVLAEGSHIGEFSLPDTSEMKSESESSMMKMMQSVAAQQIHQHDLAFGIKIFNTLAWQYTHWAKANRNFNLAQKNILEDVFGIS